MIPNAVEITTPPAGCGQSCDSGEQRVASASAGRDFVDYGLPYLLMALILTVAILILRLWFKRRWWCICGRTNWWSSDTNGRHNSQHIMDAYSFTHFLHGIMFYWPVYFIPVITVHHKAAIVFFIESLWEVIENSPPIIEKYRTATVSSLYEGDSIANTISDITVCMLGFAYAYTHVWYISLITFVLVELILIHEVRDSLVINMVMLVHSFPQIRKWQQELPKDHEEVCQRKREATQEKAVKQDTLLSTA